jgi:hypothetical protein
MTSNSRLRRGLAIATVGSAFLAPAASAAPIEQMVPSTANGSVESKSVPPPPSSLAPSAGDAYDKLRSPDQPNAQPAAVRVVQAGADDGFDWGDAGIGAGGLLALAAIAAGTVVAIRHRPDIRHTAA